MQNRERSEQQHLESTLAVVQEKRVLASWGWQHRKRVVLGFFLRRRDLHALRTAARARSAASSSVIDQVATRAPENCQPAAAAAAARASDFIKLGQHPECTPRAHRPLFRGPSTSAPASPSPHPSACSSPTSASRGPRIAAVWSRASLLCCSSWRTLFSPLGRNLCTAADPRQKHPVSA